MDPMDLTVLDQFCRSYKLETSDEIFHQFERYLSSLQHFNQAMNLVGPMSEKRMLNELLLDSLRPVTVAEPKGPLLDVGTGAGLPGIPIKLLFPDLETHLVEPRKKRHTFLKIVKQRLGLENLHLHRKRIEQLEIQRDFRWVISKAFQPPAQWLATARDWIRADGEIVCMTTGPFDEELEDSVTDLGLVEKTSASYELSEQTERRCIRIYERTDQ